MLLISIKSNLIQLLHERPKFLSNYSNINIRIGNHFSITEFDSIKCCKKPFELLSREHGKKKETGGIMIRKGESDSSINFNKLCDSIFYIVNRKIHFLVSNFYKFLI